jgi:O-acetyl-ADP-ribose deacetylase (regulator of RNase III)
MRLRFSAQDGRHRILELVHGDITQQATDAIVNAANSSLMGGGGVDGAIHRAGGPGILEDCRRVRERRGPLPEGQAVATSAGRLKAKHVIHTVGPVWYGGERDEPRLLASCYRETLRLAEELRLTSIAFPSISTGAFRYPVVEAARVAVEAVRESLLNTRTVELARFVLFDVRTLTAYQTATHKLVAEHSEIAVESL